VRGTRKYSVHLLHLKRSFPPELALPIGYAL
jgi:hypothetical protein